MAAALPPCEGEPLFEHLSPHALPNRLSKIRQALCQSVICLWRVKGSLRRAEPALDAK
jgi:hypothetical protein